LSGDVILGLIIDPLFKVDIDTPEDWKKYETLVKTGGLQMVDPVNPRHGWPSDPRLLVLDFDGVLTDNRVWVNEEGREMIAANRSDSHGLALLHSNTGIDAMVLSREVNPVVTSALQENEPAGDAGNTRKRGCPSADLCGKRDSPRPVDLYGKRRQRPAWFRQIRFCCSPFRCPA